MKTSTTKLLRTAVRRKVHPDVYRWLDEVKEQVECGAVRWTDEEAVGVQLPSAELWCNPLN